MSKNDFLTEILGIFIKAIIDNTVAIIAIVVAIIVGIITIYYAVKSYLLSKQEVEKKAKIKISLYRQDVNNEVYFIIPFKSCRKFLIPLTLQIKNEGNLSAKDVEVYIEMNDSLCRRDFGRELSDIAKAKNMAIAAEEGNSKDMTTLYTKVGNIPPSQSVRVVHEFFADRITVLDIPVEVITKDNVKAKMNIELTVSLIFNITVSCENAEPVRKELNIQFRKGSAKRLEQFCTEELKLIQKPSNVKDDGVMPRFFIFFEKYTSVRNPSEKKGDYRIYRAEHNSIKFLILEKR